MTEDITEQASKGLTLTAPDMKEENLSDEEVAYPDAVVVDNSSQDMIA